MAGISNDVLFGKNADFSKAHNLVVRETNGLITDGQLWIGSTALNVGNTHINVGTITSPLGTLTIGYSSPNITIDLTGGAASVEKFTVDTTTGAGTNPVVPTAGGIVTVSGGQYPSGTFGTRVITIVSDAPNQYRVEAQISTTSAATDITKNGISHYKSTDFSVDANGFVSFSTTGAAKTITGDSGGALSPVANNWNILGLSGSKTSGSGSTLTVKSPPFSQIGSSATSVLNTGEFVTAAVTRTLPVSAGLADGDLFIYSCTTAGALIIQSVGSQKIRIGTLLSSAAGAAQSTAIGDSITLRFDATQGFFMAVSVVGTWIVS